MNFSKEIIHWYLQNKRDLPWRKTKDPYRIWLSEIMLQQTRVAQGLPYYEKFTAAFPTVYDLAKAEESQVLKLWQGLGYYSRARNLHYTAKDIVENYNGKFPSTYKELLQLKGVGDYTASAIASICFDEVAPVVDGNVYRVLARYFDIDTPINSTEGIKKFKELAFEVIAEDDPANFNQAIMEFGAVQCKPQNPYCIVCPLNNSCEGLKNQRVGMLPVKLKKTKIKHRWFNYLVVIAKETETLLEERTGKGIWQGLYQFPLLETKKAITDIHSHQEEIKALVQLRNFSITPYNTEAKIHKLSHQHLHTTFWIVETTENLKNGILLQEIRKYPVPILIGNFIEEFNF
ncbi:A/G-specific DNA-adenine glycosylase [Kordia periserrulae]|uniref:Adenine DNA glycosylase n=1 Tax=Kordia periserrulae TaxID=701523 RepID=A0A2T6BVD7_9FLAO|nr:A/G-specific adenine glycosylase [Kordia periserrulae]PTX60031.1 A/G-specific DNA-adenine glycosylase [Kordia periserrulae]